MGVTTEWTRLYPMAAQPEMAQIDAYVDDPIWTALQAFLADTYGAAPQLSYSRCGMEPGWNVKYKKGSKALCTVYVRKGYVTAMVSIAGKDEAAAENVLLTCTDYTRELYARSAASKMGRWLMINVTGPEILEDVKALLRLRVKPAQQA